MRLRKLPDAYQRLLDANYKWIAADLDLSYRPQNFRVYEFDEIGGRTAEVLADDVTRKISRLNAIQNNDFTEACYVFGVRRGVRPTTPSRLTNETMAML